MYHSFETSYTRSNTISPSIQSTSKMKPFHQLNCNQKHSDRMRKGFFASQLGAHLVPTESPLSWWFFPLQRLNMSTRHHGARIFAKIFQDLGLTGPCQEISTLTSTRCSLPRSVSCPPEKGATLRISKKFRLQSCRACTGASHPSGEASSSPFCHSDDFSPANKKPMFGPFFMVNVGTKPSCHPHLLPPKLPHSSGS